MSKRKVRVVFRPAKQQEFGLLPASYSAEFMQIGYGAYLGTGRTQEEAIRDLLWKVKTQAGEEIPRGSIEVVN